MVRTAASSFTIKANNYIRLDDGYFVLSGSQTAYLTGLIEGGYFQLKLGDDWEVVTDVSQYQINYYDAAKAKAATGYEFAGGNWTVITVTAMIPEAGTTALLLTGAAGCLAFRRGHRKR